MSNIFKIGDKISVIDELIWGEIKKIKDQEVLILNQYGFDEWYTIRQIVPRFELEIDYSTPIPIKDSVVNKKIKPVVKRNELIIDLHHVHLKSKYSDSNTPILIQQLDYARQEIDKARENQNVQTLILIHGLGSGKLRQELTKILNDIGLAFFDTDYKRFSQNALAIDVTA